ncbi:STAS domain protein [Oscillibacter sp. KLE 1745]|nr:STAS domain protein [Oscillibacter sp. KLE 1745]
MGRFLIMGGKTGYPVSWYTNDKEEGNFMEIEATSADRNLLLEMKGELDHHGARNALRELELSIDAALPKKLVLDLAGVTFMDSSGIALILRAQQRMQLLDGSLLVRNVPQQARRVLDAAGIGRLVTIR